MKETARAFQLEPSPWAPNSATDLIWSTLCGRKRHNALLMATLAQRNAYKHRRLAIAHPALPQSLVFPLLSSRP